MIMPRLSGCDPNAFSALKGSVSGVVLVVDWARLRCLPMEEVKDSGADTSVLYETETAPSAVRVTCESLATVAIVLRRIVLVMESIWFALRAAYDEGLDFRERRSCAARAKSDRLSL